MRQSILGLGLVAIFSLAGCGHHAHRQSCAAKQAQQQQQQQPQVIIVVPADSNVQQAPAATPP